MQYLCPQLYINVSFIWWTVFYNARPGKQNLKRPKMCPVRKKFLILQRCIFNSFYYLLQAWKLPLRLTLRSSCNLVWRVFPWKMPTTFRHLSSFWLMPIKLPFQLLYRLLKAIRFAPWRCCRQFKTSSVRIYHHYKWPQEITSLIRHISETCSSFVPIRLLQFPQTIVDCVYRPICSRYVL